jgi:DmsE family decaheme c-type cytochrome
MMRSAIPAALMALMCLTGGGWAEEGVGLETCEICHDEVAAEFVAGSHGRAMAVVDRQLLEASCETCHGPGATHADDPATDNIRRVPDADACVSCHVGSGASLALGAAAHERYDVACLECHVSGHSMPDAEPLLQAGPAKLCVECHGDIGARFRLPFAHRDGRGPQDCTTCHAVHSTTEAGRRSLLGAGAECAACHVEKTGPFVFPHAPREIDGCVACHEPHGSTNPRQLRRRSVADLCLECHAGVPATHNLARTRYQDCQNCHLAVHGSNRDPRLFRE